MTEITRLMVTDVLNKLKEKEDQQVFFQCSSGTFYDNLFRVAVSTGLRPGELFALTEDNLDFSKKDVLKKHCYTKNWRATLGRPSTKTIQKHFRVDEQYR